MQRLCMLTSASCRRSYPERETCGAHCLERPTLLLTMQSMGGKTPRLLTRCGQLLHNALCRMRLSSPKHSDYLLFILWVATHLNNPTIITWARTGGRPLPATRISQRGEREADMLCSSWVRRCLPPSGCAGCCKKLPCQQWPGSGHCWKIHLLMNR